MGPIIGAHNALIDGRRGHIMTWAELPDLIVPAPAAVVVSTSFEALPAVARHARTGVELLVVARDRMEQSLESELLKAGFNLVHRDEVQTATNPRDQQKCRLWLLTSGSTGRPKRIGHTLESLTTVSSRMDPRRWLCPYSPGTYAWWQMITLGLAMPGQDLVLVDPADLQHWVPTAIEHGVTAASGTPTFWRQTIMAQGEELARVPLRQVTLGGEPVDQSVLDQLTAILPHARVSWIYASSEVGSSIVVHDGKAGFPVEWLDRDAAGRPRISVHDGELIISSPHHGAGFKGAVPTGDAVVVEEGRVLITGRTSADEINVGGGKISAGVVRSVLQAHPEVAWAHVRGRRAPMVGQMVVADVVLRSRETSAPKILAELNRWCEERLPGYGVPRRIRLLAEIPAKETLKSDV